MPIYEFRCLSCRDIFELLFLTENDKKEIRCPHCGGEELERVLSVTNYAKGASSRGPQVSTSTTSCGEGTCGTIEIPGGSD